MFGSYFRTLAIILDSDLIQILFVFVCLFVLFFKFCEMTFVFCLPDSLLPFPWRLDKGCSLRGRTIQRGLRFPVPSNTKGDNCFLTTNSQRIADLGISLGVRDLHVPRGIYVHVPDHRYM